MIGSAVNKNVQSLCGQYMSQIPPTSVTGLSTVTEPGLSTVTQGLNTSFQPGNGTTPLPVGGGGISEFDKCKAQIATSVSLMAAIIQVFIVLSRACTKSYPQQVVPNFLNSQVVPCFVRG